VRVVSGTRRCIVARDELVGLHVIDLVTGRTFEVISQYRAAADARAAHPGPFDELPAVIIGATRDEEWVQLGHDGVGLILRPLSLIEFDLEEDP
jgi:hypothetical protein